MIFYACINLLWKKHNTGDNDLDHNNNDGWGWWRLWRQRFWVDGVDNRQSGTFFLPRACFLSPVVTLRTHSLFSITINIVGFLIFGRQWGEEFNHSNLDPTHCKVSKHWKTEKYWVQYCLSSMSKHFIVFLSRFPGRMCWVWWWPWPLSVLFLRWPYWHILRQFPPFIQNMFQADWCCVYFKPTSVTLSNDKSLLQARQARQDQGRQRCPVGIAQVSSDAFSEFVRSSAAIVRQ